MGVSLGPIRRQNDDRNSWDYTKEGTTVKWSKRNTKDLNGLCFSPIAVKMFNINTVVCDGHVTRRRNNSSFGWRNLTKRTSGRWRRRLKYNSKIDLRERHV
jgi:hypothetical protein